ncbi:hypothetical protein MAR_022643 [Mya arenaria]|uniref:Uncharacterized protein n=1 Tax=Mya arenaria TaxID=6604 RepID=A0ABY7DTJ0_MYAAR|nr:uncharacterized protein LOC128228469 [Mya arenaria]WAQ98270.1 hypothetical protein MAR_022643 [Mya arenaria]
MKIQGISPKHSFGLILVLARTSLGGECCNGYHDLSGEYHGSQWCSDLCCGSSKLGLLNCCNTPILTAPDTDKSTTCGKFFKEPQDIWIPIVIGLGVVVFLAGLGKAIACCCQYCDKRSGTNGVQPQETPTPPSEARTEDFHHKQTPPISHVRTLHVNCYSGSQYSGYLVKYNNAHAQQAWVPLGSEHEKE